MRNMPRCQCRGVPCGRPHCDEAFVKVGQTFLSAHLNSWRGNGDGKKTRPACARTVVPWKAKGPTMSPRKCVYRVFGVKDNRTDGRFFAFAQNDMFCNIHRRNLSAGSRHKLSC